MEHDATLISETKQSDVKGEKFSFLGRGKKARCLTYMRVKQVVVVVSIGKNENEPNLGVLVRQVLE